MIVCVVIFCIEMSFDDYVIRIINEKKRYRKRIANERENEAHRIRLHNAASLLRWKWENFREKGNGENQCKPDQGQDHVEIFLVICLLLLPAIILYSALL